MLDPLYTLIAYVLKLWHGLFSSVLDPAGGISWALSIVFLVVTVRIVLFRFFVKQVKSQRAMQEIQPEIQKLKKQYGSDRQGFSQAVMALQKERGVNPLAGCLPILPQIPIFISLYHVLSRLAPGKPGLYSWDGTLTDQAAIAKLFGAPISSQFNMPPQKAAAILPLASYTNIRLVAMALIVIMVITAFVTQRQIMRRSGPVEGQAAQVQRVMLYGMPLSLFVTGFFFPIGVLLYWVTNNLWTLGQQLYILRKLPPPGAPGAGRAAGSGPSPDSPAPDSRTLAPRPGAKPVRNRPGKPAAAPGQGTAATDGTGPTASAPTGSGATAATGAGGSAGDGGGVSDGAPPGPSPAGASRAGQGSGKAKRKRR